MVQVGRTFRLSLKLQVHSLFKNGKHKTLPKPPQVKQLLDFGTAKDHEEGGSHLTGSLGDF